MIMILFSFLSFLFLKKNSFICWWKTLNTDLWIIHLIFTRISFCFFFCLLLLEKETRETSKVILYSLLMYYMMHIGRALNIASVTSAIIMNFCKLESSNIVYKVGSIFESRHKLTFFFPLYSSFSLLTLPSVILL